MSGDPSTVITVPLVRLTAASAPQICLKTGDKAQCLVPTVASTIPRWAWVLMAAGGVPFLAARRWLFPRAELLLPARNTVAARWGLVTRGLAGCFAVAAVLLVWSLITLSAVSSIAAVFVGATATAVWWLLMPSVWILAELDGTQVRLSGVHVSAARALTSSR